MGLLCVVQPKGWHLNAQENRPEAPIRSEAGKPTYRGMLQSHGTQCTLMRSTSDRQARKRAISLLLTQQAQGDFTRTTASFAAASPFPVGSSWCWSGPPMRAKLTKKPGDLHIEYLSEFARLPSIAVFDIPTLPQRTGEKNCPPEVSDLDASRPWKRKEERSCPNRGNNPPSLLSMMRKSSHRPCE